MSPAQVKFDTRAKKINSLLCVGLDTDIAKIGAEFRGKDYPQFEFNKHIIDTTAPYAAAFKPNAAFYEARGVEGWRELAMTIDYIRSEYPDIFTILDAKRGDIGNTNQGYVTSIFDEMGFDAVTLNPYMGREALKPFLEREDKVSIILCSTSNDGAGEFQDLKAGTEPVFMRVARRVTDAWNEKGNCMLVVGATKPAELRMVRDLVGDMTILVPGIGTQGGEVEDVVHAGLNKEKLGLVVAVSRSLIYAESPLEEAKAIVEEINASR